MRVGIDGRYLRSGRGIGNYTRSLIRNLSEWEKDISLVVYVPGQDHGCGLPPTNGCISVQSLPAAPFPVWEQMLLPLAARRHSLDVLHCTANTAPLAPAARLVVTVHDTMFMTADQRIPRSPSWYQRAGARYRRVVAPVATRHASMVITDSERSRADVVRELSLPSHKVAVIAPTVDPAFRRLDEGEARRSLPRELNVGFPYVLALGARDPRKNTPCVVASFARYRGRGGDRHLVITGADAATRKRLMALATVLKVPEQVHVLDFVSGEELVALYNCADALLYPSLREGFGMPLLEAMACATPIITSSTSSLPEVAGDAALLVDPGSVESIALGLERLLGEDSLRTALVERGRLRLLCFSAERAAHATADVYRRA
ncbi:MAG TPA: glycosyltransferase family 1 protein [Candidatus Sulfotelmatobacter sp.]|nr:glycosyltransferase family 1 protein [Candidatus Sulfotelmatobacter sp.]